MPAHWKIVNRDGTTGRGENREFYWPLVVAHAGQDPVRVEAGGPFTAEGGPAGPECPSAPGDGLCYAITPKGARSGGLSLSDSVGLILHVDPDDILAEGPDKGRAKAVTVVDSFDPCHLIRLGLCKDLAGADLRGADMLYANLAGANLAYANMTGADMRGAIMAGAIMAGANMTGADMRWADLRGADLFGASMTGADLAGADLAGATHSNQPEILEAL